MKFLKNIGAWIKDKVYLKVLLMMGKAIFGDRWKGIKTLVVGMLTSILGLWTWMDGSGLYGQLCSVSSYFCDIKEGTFYAAMLMVIGVINQVLRAVTDSPIQGVK